MARPHRPVQGNRYEKRRVATSAPAPSPPPDALTSNDARRLGVGIASTQKRYRVTAIRLITGRACGLVVVDSLTGGERTLTSAKDWHRLQAQSAGPHTLVG